MAEDRAARTWTNPAASLLVAAGVLVFLVATEPKLAMVWDEGYTLGREARVRDWLRAVRDPAAFARTWSPPVGLDGLVEDRRTPPKPQDIDTRSKLFSADVIAWFWPFGREEPHGHPPFYAIVGVLGDAVVPSWADLPRSRFGPMLVFSLAAGAIFGAFLKRSGVWPASLAASAWTLHPHLFALGHYAGYDAILSALWVSAILAFGRAVAGDAAGRPRWGSVVAFGILCGWAADTKLTGWFLPLPFVAWSLLARSRRGGLAIVVGGVVAILTLYAFNPPWWAEPIGGPVAFFRSNLTRDKTVKIWVMFLGTNYLTPAQSLPFYNTLVWTAIATPVGFLAFALVGAIRAIRDRAAADPLPMLALAHWLFLLALRALPHAPGHDGVRQFLPAFGCLALVAGVGAGWVVSRWKNSGKALVAMAIVEGAVSVAVMMPVPLSYFSPIVGGLPGATKMGMEPTYYWDALSAEALDRLARDTPTGRTVAFATFPTSWVHLRKTGAIRFGLYRVDPGPPAWYVVQNRPGALSKLDRALIRAIGPRHVLVAKFGVPLVWSFPYREVERAQTLMPPSPRGAP